VCVCVRERERERERNTVQKRGEKPSSHACSARPKEEDDIQYHQNDIVSFIFL
jgi:hypothetical protein